MTNMDGEKKKTILGLVTARGGSKRVPGKNVKELCGKPLLTWTVEAGKKSGVLDRFVLTTDDSDIARVGKEAGIEVPFMRPAELANDTARSYQAVRHAVEWLRDKENYEADWIILLEPSSPGRQPFHITEVAEIITTRNDFDSLIGISQTPGHFSYLKELVPDEHGIVTRAYDGNDLHSLILRNQEVPASYYINSTVYAFKTANLFDGKNSCWGGGGTYGYSMDEKYAFDIDTPTDWLVAEVKMKQLLSEI